MAEVPYRVDKPWGYELVWARTDKYVGKILHVKAGHVLSLQLPQPEGRDHARPLRRTDPAHPAGGHSPRAALQGRRVGAHPPTLIHQIEAVVDTDVLEASSPELDDLVRLQDRYGRRLEQDGCR